LTSILPPEHNGAQFPGPSASSFHPNAPCTNDATAALIECAQKKADFCAGKDSERSCSPAVRSGGTLIPLFQKLLLVTTAGILGMTAICQAPVNGPAPRSTPYTGLTPHQASDSHWTVVEGDIIQDKNTLAVQPRPDSLTVATTSSLWPQVAGVATVYYLNANAGAMDAADMAANANIQTAIDTFNADFSGLIQWMPWVSADGPNYVEINLNAGDFSGECEAAEGYEAEPVQPMAGSAACTVGTILHEMGHIIGLWHEFVRPDASNYVTINYNNVIKGSWGNFETQTQNAQILGLYDYASVMQYPPYSFSRNGGPVIETIPAGMPLGSAEGIPVPASSDYSAGDKEAIERLYGAAPTQVTVTSNPVGLQVEVDGSMVATPQTFAWTLNSTHTLSVPAGVQMLTGDIDNSTTSATFYYNYGRWNDNGAQTHTITVLPGDGAVGFPPTSPQVATYSANFIQLVPYTSAVYPASSGTVAIAPQPQSYSGASGQFFIARQQATLTATPAAGWNFYEFNNGPFWLPGGLGANPKTFYVPDTGNPVDTTAEFSNTPIYTVDITPETFSSNLYVYVDGEFYDTPVNFSHYYDYEGQTTPTWTAGSTHTLDTDSPEYPYSSNSRYSFSSWSDGGEQSHSIASLPGTATSYIATVTPEFAPATNFNYPPCGGTGTLTPASPTGDGFYPSGTMLTYSATHDSMWTFAGWTFDLTGTTTPANLSPTDESLVFANFNITNAPLTLTNVSPGSAISGGAAFTLALYGTGFGAASVVGVSGGSGTTYPAVTYVSANELQIPITQAQIASAGSLQVYVENFPQGTSGCAVFGYQTFIVHASSLATSTAVVSSGSPSSYGASVTFTATVAAAESNATGIVTFYNGSTAMGTGTLNSSGMATYSTTSLAAGPNAITAVYGGDSNNLGSTSSVLTQTVLQAAQLTSPVPSSLFPGPSVTFTWTTPPGATYYELYIGSTGIGSSNLYSSGKQTVTSLAVTGLPTNGETVNVRLLTNFSGTWQYADYTYTAVTRGVLTTPVPGSSFGGLNVTFSWTAATGTEVSGYRLYLGSTGVGSNNLYSSALLSGTSFSALALPTNGETIYARLITSFNGALAYYDYTYKADTQSAIVSPAPGGLLPSRTVTFTWSTAVGATGYELWLGTTGVGSNNLYNSLNQKITSITVPNLPSNGSTIYARMLTDFNGSWTSVDYTYTSVTQSAMTSPAQGSALTGASVTFSWTSGVGATAYQLYLGSTGVGSNNLYNSGSLAGTSFTAANLPTNGETIYARLLTNFNGSYATADYTYTADTHAVMASPVPGTVLPGPSVTFTWSAATGATAYELYLGSTGAGSSNLYSSGSKTVTTLAVTGLPTNGETIYARVLTNFNGVWGYADYTYTAATHAVMASPSPGSALTGTGVTFTITPATGTEATAYELFLGSTGVGSSNLYSSGQKSGTSFAVTGLPSNGETIYARVLTNFGGTWGYVDYTYAAYTAP
jgi:hypothetical protein